MPKTAYSAPSDVSMGLAEVAARLQVALRQAGTPWHVRAPAIEIAAALLRYLERTYEDDRIGQLDDLGIEIAYAAEEHPTSSHDRFVRGAHELQDFAAEHGWSSQLAPISRN